MTDAAPHDLTRPVDFEVAAADYRHWRLSVDGDVARVDMDVNPDAGLRPGYELKLNSYDLGVDARILKYRLQ